MHKPEETSGSFPQPPTCLESYVDTILLCSPFESSDSARITPDHPPVLFCNDLWPQKIQPKVI